MYHELIFLYLRCSNGHVPKAGLWLEDSKSTNIGPNSAMEMFKVSLSSYDDDSYYFQNPFLSRKLSEIFNLQGA